MYTVRAPIGNRWIPETEHIKVNLIKELLTKPGEGDHKEGSSTPWLVTGEPRGVTAPSLMGGQGEVTGRGKLCREGPWTGAVTATSLPSLRISGQLLVLYPPSLSSRLSSPSDAPLQSEHA